MPISQRTEVDNKYSCTQQTCWTLLKCGMQYHRSKTWAYAVHTIHPHEVHLYLSYIQPPVSYFIVSGKRRAQVLEDCLHVMRDGMFELFTQCCRHGWTAAKLGQYSTRLEDACTPAHTASCCIPDLFQQETWCNCSETARPPNMTLHSYCITA